ncbi:hypothetical protein LEN26_006185 [Aphanomyces euteiches]|nr:hypothetical protein LEN26_006185 [Aphanomyces euteiches]
MLRKTLIETGICEVTLTSAKSRNALSLDLIRELTKTFNSIHDDSSIRAVILGAEGPAFSSGHHLKEVLASRVALEESGAIDASSAGSALLQTTFEECSALMQRILHLNQPVIAKVDGVATAAGCQLVATCDLAYASTTSHFCTPGVSIGLFCTTPGVALSRSVGRKHAMKMLLTGEMVNAEEAARIGLINNVVPSQELDDVVLSVANTIASKSQLATRIGKTAFYKQLDMPLPNAYDYASTVMWNNMLAHDAKEGIQSFLAKTAPKWTNK